MPMYTQSHMTVSRLNIMCVPKEYNAHVYPELMKRQYF